VSINLFLFKLIHQAITRLLRWLQYSAYYSKITAPIKNESRRITPGSSCSLVSIEYGIPFGNPKPATGSWDQFPGVKLNINPGVRIIAAIYNFSVNSSCSFHMDSVTFIIVNREACLAD
jgi:hypothetical protein